MLQEVLNRYVGQRIYRILDHAKIHHAQALAPFLADHAALHLVFLPPYSPNLNNVERLGKWLRKTRSFSTRISLTSVRLKKPSNAFSDFWRRPKLKFSHDSAVFQAIQRKLKYD